MRESICKHLERIVARWRDVPRIWGDGTVLIMDDPTKRARTSSCSHDWGPEWRAWVTGGLMCRHGCGTWQGRLGLEPYNDMFVEHMIEILVEARRERGTARDICELITHAKG